VPIPTRRPPTIYASPTSAARNFLWRSRPSPSPTGASHTRPVRQRGNRFPHAPAFHVRIAIRHELGQCPREPDSPAVVHVPELARRFNLAVRLQRPLSRQCRERLAFSSTVVVGNGASTSLGVLRSSTSPHLPELRAWRPPHNRPRSGARPCYLSRRQSSTGTILAESLAVRGLPRTPPAHRDRPRSVLEMVAKQETMQPGRRPHLKPPEETEACGKLRLTSQGSLTFFVHPPGLPNQPFSDCSLPVQSTLRKQPAPAVS